jgi:hypothetical protein
MEAKKNIELNLPDENEIGLVDEVKYNTIESKVAYYNLLIKEGEKYYKEKKLWDEKINQDLIGLLRGEVYSLKNDLERERKTNKPLGFMFSNIVIEIELDMYDTIEEQIEYLKIKIKEFDIATINVYTNEYDVLKDKLKQFILSRYSILKNKNCDWDDFIFDGLWIEIVDTHFDPYRINNAIDRVGKNKAAKFRDFIKENFNRFTIDEWMREYDTKDKLSKIDGFNKDYRLTELERHLKIVNVWDGKFLDGELGKETMSRLKLFEEKFVKENRSDEIEKNTELKVGQEEEWDLNKEIEKLLDRLTEADTVEEKIYKDIEYWENFSKVRYRGTDDVWIGESWEIAVGMLRTFINNLKQAKVTGYYKGKKINFEAADRLNKLLLEVIKEIESRNVKNEIDEMDEVNEIKSEAISAEKIVDTEKNGKMIVENKIKKTNARKKIITSNEVIAEEVVKLWDNGTEEFKEIYKKLSDDSERIFTEKLTEGQIKGKYQRFANKNRDFKRKK